MAISFERTNSSSLRI
jgi:hypothetical protein